MEWFGWTTKDHDAQQLSTRGWMGLEVAGRGIRLEMGMAIDLSLRKMVEQQYCF